MLNAWIRYPPQPLPVGRPGFPPHAAKSARSMLDAVVV